MPHDQLNAQIAETVAAAQGQHSSLGAAVVRWLGSECPTCHGSGLLRKGYKIPHERCGGHGYVPREFDSTWTPEQAEAATFGLVDTLVYRSGFLLPIQALYEAEWRKARNWNLTQGQRALRALRAALEGGCCERHAVG